MQDLRVILVGSGLARAVTAQRLRRDARTRVVKAQNSHEALGELGLPPANEAGVRTVIVLSKGAIEPETVGGFVRSVRRVDSGARIVAMTENGVSWLNGATKLLDGTIEVADLGAETLRGLFSADRPRLAAQDDPGASTLGVSDDVMAGRDRACEGAGGGDPATGPLTAGTTEQALLQADTGVVRALLTGGDVQAACLRRLHASLGPDIRWIGPDAAEGEHDEHKAAVVHRGRAFGFLASRSTDPATLSACAAWMAQWLALREQHVQLRRAAFTDPLTGAWNRRYFDRFLPAAIEDARRHRHDLTLLLFDIDDFKHFNDHYGHSAGDEVLVETVRLMKTTVRPCDRVCRIGGDEFAVVFYEPEGPRDPGSKHPTSIYSIAERFQEKVRRHQFPKLGAEAAGSLAISGGMATFPWDGADAEALIEHADRLLGESKRMGKNAIRFGPAGSGPVID